jgi:hypothetical protein
MHQRQQTEACQEDNAPLGPLKSATNRISRDSFMGQARFVNRPRHSSGATTQAASAQLPQVLRNASRSALSWSLCVSATPCEAPG